MITVKKSDFQMPKVYVTLRQGRTVVKKGSLDWDQVIDLILTATGNARDPILARDKLNRGETFKYKHAGYNVTLTPLYGESY